MGRDAIILLNQTISKKPEQKKRCKFHKFELNDRNNSPLSKQQYFMDFYAKFDKFLKKKRKEKVTPSSEMQCIYVKIVCAEASLQNQRR